MFITFEGIDGSGKSTQAKLFAAWLRDKCGAEVVLTKEPGGCDVCAPLRDMVVSGALSHPWSEFYLFMLDRAEHVANVIEPALRRGAFVVCERYQASTLAYQAWGRGLPLDVLEKLGSMSGFPVPDVTFFFDLPVDEALRRVSKRGQADAFEKNGPAFMNKVREGYLSLASLEPRRWVTIDPLGASVDEVFRRLVSVAEERICR